MSLLSRLAIHPLAFVVAASLALTACDSVEERAQKHYERGVALVEENDDVKAQLEFRNALQLDGEHVGARFQMAQLSERGGNRRAALASYRRVAELDPTNFEARLKSAQFLVEAGDGEASRRMIDEALALEPDNVEALAIKSVVELRSDRPDEALAAAQRALELDPSHVGANISLVALFKRSGDEAAAWAQLEKALMRSPQNEPLNVLKLQLLSEGGDLEAITRHLQDLATMFPENSGYRRALAQSLHAAGDREGAEAQLRALADLKPDDSEAALDVMRYLFETQGAEAARAELEARIAADPAAATPFEFALSALELRSGRPDAAKAILERIAAREEGARDGDTALVELARLALADGDAATASANVEKVLARDTNNVEALSVRAALAIEDYRPEDAILDLRRALNLAPQNHRLMLLEARAHERNGALSLAGERLAAAMRASEFAPDVALQYARHLRGSGQLGAAETAVSESARRHPSNASILTALAELRLLLGDTAGAAEVAAQLRALQGGETVADQVTAAVLAREGMEDESVRLLERIVADDDGASSALVTLVASYVRDGNVDRAVALLDELIAKHPRDLRALGMRAELHLRAGETAQAEQRLRDMIAADPAQPASYLALSRFFANQGQGDEAEASLRQGVAAAPGSDLLRLALAEWLERRNDFDGAIAEYRTVYENNSDSLIAANNLASLLAEHRADDPEALRTASRVARRLRESPVPHFQDTHGWIAFLTGDMEAARTSLEAAAEGLPNNALVRYHLGRYYAAASDPSQAREHLEASLSLDPGFVKAESARAALAELSASGG